MTSPHPLHRASQDLAAWAGGRADARFDQVLSAESAHPGDGDLLVLHANDEPHVVAVLDRTRNADWREAIEILDRSDATHGQGAAGCCDEARRWA